MGGSEASAALSSLLSLLAVLVVLGGGLILGRYLQRRGRLPAGAFGRGGETTAIRQLSSRPLGWQASVQLLEVDGRRFLIGVSRAGITRIDAWPSVPAPPAPTPLPGRQS